jgi:hypothetical protein
MNDQKLKSLQTPLTWARLGKLSDLEGTDKGGVYLLIHEGKFNRVLYVGTTSNFSQRLATHRDGFLRGNRTIWKVTAKDDIYCLMTAWHLKNSVSYFKKLAEQDMLWGTTTMEMLSPKNLLAQEKPFSSEWLEFLRTEYLPRISVWALKLDPYSAQTAVLIESAIQQRLVKVFQLGRFFNHKDLSILGKIEFNSNVVRIKRPFLNVPDVDEASKLVFAALDAKSIPEAAVTLAAAQLKKVIDARAINKQKREETRQKLNILYPRQGLKWEPVDDEKLRSMLVDFKMTAAEISPILGRKTSSIHSHIVRRDKLTDRVWRKPRLPKL